MKKTKKYEFCEYDKNRRNLKNDKKCIFSKYRKMGISKKHHIFRNPKKGYFGPP